MVYFKKATLLSSACLAYLQSRSETLCLDCNRHIGIESFYSLPASLKCAKSYPAFLTALFEVSDGVPTPIKQA
jgi:hypothetical protein